MNAIEGVIVLLGIGVLGCLIYLALAPSRPRAGRDSDGGEGGPVVDSCGGWGDSGGDGGGGGGD